jgi:hypothetical protein
MITDMAERDPALLRKLKIATAAAGADDKALESQLRGAIRDATRVRGFVHYRRAPGLAAGVDATLGMLAELASGPRAALVVELADYASTQIERAVENIDDSHGYCSALLTHAQRIRLAACRTAKPDPLALARDLFLRETEGTYDTISVQRRNMRRLAEFRRLAREA